MRFIRRVLEWLRVLPKRPPPPIHPLVLDYIRSRPKEISANLERNNALLKWLKERPR